MKKLYGIILCILVITAILSISLVTSGCNQKKEIKIGVILSLTGKVTKYGEDSKRGMDIAVEEINAGKKYPFSLKLLYEDDKAEATTAVSALRKLIEVDRVPIIVGFILSNNALACAPIAESKKVNILITCASAEKIKDAGDYIFRIRESAAIHGREMANYARNTLTINEVAILYANAENGYSYSRAFQEEFLKLGGTIVFTESFEEGEKDFRSLITKAKAKNPEGVYLAGLPIELGLILQQSKELKFEPKNWIASSGAEDPKLIEIAKGAADGLIISSPPFDPSSSNEKVKDFVKSYQKQYNSEPAVLAANGYDAVYIIADVIRQYGSSSEEIKTGLYHIKDFEGVGGRISLDEFGEAQRPVLFKKVINEKFEIIKQSTSDNV